MAFDGVIRNPCKASLAVPDCTSFSNSTKAISERPGTKRTSLNPGNWLNNIDNIISVVSMGRFVKNKILLGCSGAATAACTGVGMTFAATGATKG